MHLPHIGQQLLDSLTAGLLPHAVEYILDGYRLAGVDKNLSALHALLLDSCEEIVIAASIHKGHDDGGYFLGAVLFPKKLDLME